MIEERIIVGENTKYPLNGLLTLPDDISKPVPAVVFVHGSGASNMDEKVGKLTPFRIWPRDWPGTESLPFGTTSAPLPTDSKCCGIRALR